MSIQSDEAKRHIQNLLIAAYPMEEDLITTQVPRRWQAEYKFDPKRRWRFDYAVSSILCANPKGFFHPPMLLYSFQSVIEIDGGTFQSRRTGHSSGVGLRGWREKNNAAMAAGWRVWHYAPDEIVRVQVREGRKTLPDMPSIITPILLELPWLVKRTVQEKL